ncbi:unnamed protein product [Cercopithifilaria johnstoni]|uniref:Uncharacterized protein n=1 Tax=Cercopithifilaria johnstoni TaxID=2874296 RepID=A0A8J2MNY6_9BILA|nr:unnamed protein product [Cercopithifilaria johnstoni]
MARTSKRRPDNSESKQDAPNIVTQSDDDFDDVEDAGSNYEKTLLLPPMSRQEATHHPIKNLFWCFIWAALNPNINAVLDGGRGDFHFATLTMAVPLAFFRLQHSFRLHELRCVQIGFPDVAVVDVL